jgi:plasmid stability protein
MATLNLNNIPQEVMNELQQRAQQFHRGVEEEAASILINAMASDRWKKELSAEQLIERAAKVRQGHPQISLTEEFLHVAKADGRAMVVADTWFDW